MSEFFGQEIQVITVSVPVGTMVEYAGDTAPTDWLKCEGQALDKSTYAALHAVLGTKFGSGDGSGAQFNLPDCRDRVTVGQSATRPVGATGGSEQHSHAAGGYATPDHQHAAGTHQHHMSHYHGVSGSTGAPNNTYGTPAGSYAPAAHGAHGHSVSGGTDWGTRNDTDPSAGYTGASDRSLAVVGQSANQSTMQPYVVCTKIIKAV